MNLYSQIESIHPTLGHGWCDFPKAIGLANLVLATRPALVLEIGTWAGKSAIPMLLALKQIGAGKLICIDPWKANASEQGQTNDADKQWWAKADHEMIYQTFLANIDKHQLTPFLEIRRVTSDESDVPAELAIVHLDGNHGPDALRDAQKFAPAIRRYGFCVLDDLNWTGGFVKLAESWLLDNGFIRLHDLGTGAVYMKNK